MKKSDYEYLKQIGAQDPIMSEYRGSFTMVGYSGPGRPSFIRQVGSYLFTSQYCYCIFLNMNRMHANKKGGEMKAIKV